MKWLEALNDYKNYLSIERGLSKNSINNYEFDVVKLIKYLEEHTIQQSPISIDAETIQEFIYSSSKSINARTQSRLISGLKSFFNYLAFEKYRDDNPLSLIETPKIGRKLPDTLSEEEIDALINAIDLKHPQGLRNHAIVEVLYSCGLRVSELTDLKISDLYFKEGFINVIGKGNKQRFIPIVKEAQQLITKYMLTDRIKTKIPDEFSDILFLNRRGKKLTRAMIFTIIKQLSTKIQLNKVISPHTFRHSFATHLLENGADLISIQQMLGHQSITTTEIYMHLDRSHLKKVVEDYHPRRHF